MKQKHNNSFNTSKRYIDNFVEIIVAQEISQIDLYKERRSLALFMIL